MDELMIDKKIMMVGAIEPNLAKEVIASIIQINEFDDAMEETKVGYVRDPIEIYLTSGGGDVWSGFSIISAIEMSETPIVVYGLGYVGSIALAIYLSCHIRMASKYTFFMYHSVSIAFEGDIKSLADTQEHVGVNQYYYDEIIKEKTSLTQEYLDDIQDRRKDDIYTAQKALELGIVNHITERADVQVELITE